MTLYDRIRQLRIRAGMSQEDLARAMGYKDRSMITKIESGKVDISQKKILAFARVLHTSPGYLMGWEDEPQLSGSNDLQLFNDVQDPQIRIVSGMMENMSEEQKQQIVAIVRAVVSTQQKG